MPATTIATVIATEMFYTRVAAATIVTSRIDGTLQRETLFIHVKEAIVIVTRLGHAATTE